MTTKLCWPSALSAGFLIAACGGDAPSAPGKTAAPSKNAAKAAAAAAQAKPVRGAAAHHVVESEGPKVFDPVPAAPETRPMKEVLAEVDSLARDQVFFFSEEPVRELQEKLAAGGERSELEAAYDRFMLGSHELRLGQTREAIADLSLAYEELAKIPDPPANVPKPERFADYIEKMPGKEAAYELGLAYLRLGENDNCVCERGGDSCIFPIAGEGIHEHEEGSLGAIKYFSEVLEAYPENLTCRWLLNIAYMTLGKYPKEVPERWRIPPAVFHSEEAFPRFHDVAPDLGLARVNLAGGAALDDFDGDGRLDILISSMDTGVQMRFWRRAEDGSFEDRSDAVGLAGIHGALNIDHADLDNDGDLDVVVPRGAWMRKAGRHPKSLLWNDGHGNFTDGTYAAGLGKVYYPSQTVAIADYDNDGDLDIFFGNEIEDPAKGAYPSELFRNEGDGTFTDVAEQAGVRNYRYTKGASWGDYDNDRWPDLYVSNFDGENRLYHNRGDGTFEDVAQELGVTKPIRSFPCWFWDFDNDGNLDIFASTYWPHVSFTAASFLEKPHLAELAGLYKGDGQGGFSDVARAQNLRWADMPMGSNFGDLDNDGWLDFYLGTGTPAYDGLVPNRLYRNRGGSGFADVTTNAGMGHLQKGHGVAFADLDEDGDQEIYEQMGGAFPGDAFGNTLYENPGFENNWIKLRLSGTRSNRSAIGARIRVDVEEGGAKRSIHRMVSTGGSFGSNPLRQEIGIGKAERVARVEVHWPTSDTRQVFEDLAAGALYEIVEGEASIRQLEVRPLPFKAASQ